MLPEELIQYRHLLMMTTQEAAKKFGVAQRTWQAYEAGTRRIPEHIADAVRKAVREAAPTIQDLLRDL